MNKMKIDVEKSSFVLEMSGRTLKDIAMVIDDYIKLRGKNIDNKLVIRDDDKDIKKILEDLMKIWNFS